jgi:TonB family protein
MLYKATHNDDFSFPLALILSIVAHGIFLLLLLNPILTNNDAQQPNFIDVTIEPPQSAIPEQKQQIVSPSKPPEDQIDSTLKDTNQLSEENISVKKEQIKRGLPDAGKSIAKSSNNQNASQQQFQQKQQETSKQTKSTPNLKLSSSELLDSLDGITAGAAKPKSASNTANASARAQPFSRPSGSGARFLGDAGSPDFLPNLPDGDITLLNAKANQFAVFVRRVAIQVFSNIRTFGWDDLTRADINAIKGDTFIIAKMSPSGQLLSVTLQGSSSSSNFDDIIIKAAKAGTKDPNPPAGALAEDGNIRFIFKARSWSEVFAGRGGIPSERRWIMLSTGLE